MQSMNLSRTILACTATLSVLGAMAMVACGDSASNSQLPTSPSKPAMTSTPTDPDDGSSGSPGSSGGPGMQGDAGHDGGGVNCTVRKPGAGPYCPFQKKYDDGGSPPGNCGAGEQCCGFTTAQGAMVDGGANIPAYCADSCEPTVPSPLPTGFISQPFECNAPEHCGAAEKCCLFPKAGAAGLSVNKNSNANQCPGYSFGRVGGSKCESACAMGEIPICSKDSDCAGGAKCTSISATGRDIGYCK